MITLAALSAAGGAAFQAGLNKIVEERVARLARRGDDPGDIKKDITPHIEATFNKCIRIKTFLNPHNPSNFLEIHTTQRFFIEGEERDHYSMVEHIKRDVKNTIITGSGGSGKSMFMRYLWLSIFEDPQGRVPIFVELRNLNQLSQFDIESYLFHTLTSGKSSISQKDFKKSLSRGDFFIILDGFDEVAHQQRERVQRSIMDLAELYDKNPIVVSSRWDDRFASWQSFDVVKVAPLHQEDTIELIGKAEFEINAKERFAKQVAKQTFFNKHKSFLSNPLLASMMLLAFSQSYDIPDKMHEFYELAFEALYKRHDSYKPGGFKREFISKLEEDDFRRLLSYFCLVSYYDQAFTFNKKKITDYVGKAKTLSGSDVVAADFVTDLNDAVCLIIREGVDYSFSHRSFQEYFAAYCMSYVTTNNFRDIVGEFAKRPNDQVIKLIEDMNPELLRDRYIIPSAEKYAKYIKKVASAKSVALHFEGTKARFRMRYRPPNAKFNNIMFSQDGDYAEFSRLIKRLCREEFAGKPLDAKRDNADINRLWPAIGGNEKTILTASASGGELKLTVSGSGKRTVLPQDHPAMAIFRKSQMHEFVANQMKSVGHYVARAQQESKRSRDAMAEVFTLKS